MQLHILGLFRGYPPHFKQREPFPLLLRKTFYRKHRPSAIRCFPFLFLKHSPSYRQRKRSLGFARDDDTRRMRFPHTLSLHDARDIHSLHCHFERSREILLALCSSLPLSQKFSPFALSHIRRYTGVQERSLGFARDDDTGIALSQHILYTMRRISSYDPQQKSPGKSRSFFCVKKTYLPNCASMVPAATAVPITPATFGPIACISR